MKVVTLMLACCGTVFAAEPPLEVVQVFRTIAESMAEQDAGLFLEQFDPSTPGLAGLRVDLESLLARGYVISTLEFESDEGDDKRRTVEVDWLWRLAGERQHRVLVKCWLKREGKSWKIVELSPLNFLTPPA